MDELQKTILNECRSIINEIKGEIIIDENEDLRKIPYGLYADDFSILLLTVSEKFNFDIELFFNNIDSYSLANISRIIAILNENAVSSHATLSDSMERR